MKTVSLDDEAYNLLKGAKRSPKDSFSDVVKRHFGHKLDGIEASAGGWADVPDARIERLKRERVEVFGTTLDDGEAASDANEAAGDAGQDGAEAA